MNMPAHKDAEPTLALNALMNTVAQVLGQQDPLTRAGEFSRCISFLISEAFRLGVNLDDLGRYCRQLATEHERNFYNANTD